MSKQPSCSPHFWGSQLSLYDVAAFAAGTLRAEPDLRDLSTGRLEDSLASAGMASHPRDSFVSLILVQKGERAKTQNEILDTRTRGCIVLWLVVGVVDRPPVLRGRGVSVAFGKKSPFAIDHNHTRERVRLARRHSPTLAGAGVNARNTTLPMASSQNADFQLDTLRTHKRRKFGALNPRSPAGLRPRLCGRTPGLNCPGQTVCQGAVWDDALPIIPAPHVNPKHERLWHRGADFGGRTVARFRARVRHLAA